MFDFPNAPIVGSTVTAPNGTVFRWDGVKWIGAGSTQVVASPYGNVGRNLIHNSLINIAQRGAGPFSVNGVYSADRWVLNCDTDTANVIIYAAVDGDRAQIGDEAAKNILGNTFTGNAAASAFFAIFQRMEDVRRFAGKTVTVSFWAKQNAGPATKIGASIDQFFGTGGSPSAYVPGVGQSVTISGAWQRYSLQFAVPSVAGKTFGTTAGTDWSQVGFWFSSGSANATRAGNIGVQSGNIALWGVQLEVGNVATPLEKPDPQVDLANCQRFYQTVYFHYGGYSGAATSYGVAMLFPVPMRATPTVVPTFTTQSGCSGSTVGVTNAAYNPATNTVVGIYVLDGTFTASADL